ncbi:MAG: DHHA1 domain-containing protein [Cellulosilyticaceae bacterium]
MSKLYYTQTYQTDFTAEVLSVTEKDGNFHIVLDQTAFYPEGGGQPSDTGFIEDCPITHVYEESDTIYHVSPKKPIKIHKLKCSIDWKRRFDHMQHHMAQHILSACLLDNFGASTLSFHLGSETCTIDTDKKLSPDELLEGERLVNELISENLMTEILYPTKQELKKLTLKKPLPKITGPVRLVQIGDLDISACCGLHPNSTLEVQMLKILKHEKHKTGLRITFIAGNRAITNVLSTNLETFTQIQKLTKECQQLSAENRKLKNTITDYEVKDMLESAPTLGDVRIIQAIHENIEPKDLQAIATRLVAYPQVIALLGLKADKATHLVFMCSKDIKKISMNHLLKDSITLIDGQGGGTDFCAQGGGKSANNLASALDYALMKVKASLS